ncbi:amidohydrolase [Arthrobacter sp. 35W]|uniref:amidohydrolase n=1 Tax=Arthrobacter sp. 35W TaxID=1132441 RepID=UPI0003FF27A3|nr:amidohydrolase [Arthrobacter sp. 35W]
MTDLIFTGGPIHTMDRLNPTAEAIAVSNGRITAAGTAGDVLALAEPHTTIVRLEGKALLPGFVEAHGHPTLGMAFRGKGVIDVRAPICPTSGQVMATITAAIAEALPGEALTVVGWEELLRPDLPEPTREFLDLLAPANPLAVLHNSAHSAWGNSLAMKAAGLGNDTPDPKGSRFVRDGSGNLTGRAEELPATLIMAGSPLRATHESAPGLLAAEYAAYSAAGVTTVGELAFDPKDRGLLRAVSGKQRSIRIRAYRMSNRPAVPAEEGSDDGFFREVGVKLWADGSPWVGSFAASFPYLDTETTQKLGFAGTKGCCKYTQNQVYELCLSALAKGEQIAIHAQGDAAIDMVLDAIEAALKQQPTENHRTRLEHCCLMTAHQFERAAGLGVTCSLFLSHVRYWGDVMLADLFGSRAENWTAARSALDAGVRISLHNDVPVTPSEPLRNIHAAVTRRTVGSGRVVGPRQRITVEEALRAVTIDAAWQLQSEDEIGSLEVGKQADFVVLDADPLGIPAEAIQDIQVVATYVHGVQTHGAGRWTVSADSAPVL